MQIYEALKKDHDNLKPLLERLVNSADSDNATRKQLISQIRDELIPHSRAEEAVFYNPLRSIEETKDIIGHSYQEHLEAEGYLRTLQTMDFVNADWTKVARKLQDALLHHIEEEENKIFDAARQVLADEEAEAMAVAFEKMKPEVRDGGFMQNTLDLIANVMPDRFADPVRKYLHKN